MKYLNKFAFLKTAHLATVHGSNILGGADINNMRNSWFSFGSHIWNAK
jgi:hypothetical protein